MIADSFSASIIKNTVTLSKFVITFKNAVFALFQNMMIAIVYSKAIFSHIAVSITILNTQLDSSNAESTKNS